jgi:hypothetical protein
MKAFFKAAWKKLLLFKFFASLLIASMFWAGFVSVSVAQEYGGSPPWGWERPKHIRGEVHAGEYFKETIGGELSLSISTEGGSFKIGIVGNSGDDLTRCVTPPFHGPNPTDIMAWHFINSGNSPGGVGQKRWFLFTLTPEDHEIECHNLDSMLYRYDENDPEHLRAQKEWGGRTSGMGWLTVTGVQLSEAAPGAKPEKIVSISFEAECALYGNLKLWILPTTYVIPNNFVGWVTIYHSEQGTSRLPLAKNRYTLRVSASGAVHTSTKLRSDLRGAKFVSSNHRVIPLEGPARAIQCFGNWNIGDGNHSVQSFFVGTSDEFRHLPHNPLLPQNHDCTEISEMN